MDYVAEICGMRITCNDMHNFCVGHKVFLNWNGEIFRRLVRDDINGMYVVVNNTRIDYSDFN